MKNVNVYALVASLLAVVSIFLPWISGSSSVTILEDTSSLFIGVAGIKTIYGILGLILAIIGGVLIFFRMKVGAVIVAILSLLVGLWHFFSYNEIFENSSINISSEYGSASAGWSLGIGFYLFMISTIAFLISALTNKVTSASNSDDFNIDTRKNLTFKIFTNKSTWILLSGFVGTFLILTYGDGYSTNSGPLVILFYFAFACGILFFSEEGENV